MMEIKQMTKEQFYAVRGSKYGYGKMQAIVKELEATGYDYCEITNPHLTISNFQATFNETAKKMGIGIKVFQRNGHLYAYKVAKDDDSSNAKTGY